MARGLLVEWMPKACANGHPFDKPHTVLIGWLPCRCIREAGGHRTWRCQACDDVTYEPPHAAEDR